jgi:hypothetical protein
MTGIRQLDPESSTLALGGLNRHGVSRPAYRPRLATNLTGFAVRVSRWSSIEATASRS